MFINKTYFYQILLIFGIIISCLCTVGETSYAQSIDRKLVKSEKTENVIGMSVYKHLVEQDDFGINYIFVEDTKSYKVIGQKNNESKTKLIIPDTFNGYPVKEIGKKAFVNGKFSQVSLGNNITKIEESAFEECAELKEVILPQSLKALGKSSFSRCMALKRVVINSELKEIKDFTFDTCSSLYQIIIPANVKKISPWAFNFCDFNILTIVAPKKSVGETFANRYYESSIDRTLATIASEKLSFGIETDTILVGELADIVVYNNPYKIKWKSSNSKIATVKEGYITGKKAGKVTITAIINGKKYPFKFKVLERTMKNVMKIITTEYVKPSMTDYEKVVGANKWLCRNVTYYPDFEITSKKPSWVHTADAAFLKGIAVCDGYAGAFKYIMDYYGIPCKNIGGGGHAWNLVKIGGKWYHVDVTFNDPVAPSYNGKLVGGRYAETTFLLKSDKEMKGSHIWNKSNYPQATSSSINKYAWSSKKAPGVWINRNKKTLLVGEKASLKIRGTSKK